MGESQDGALLSQTYPVAEDSLTLSTLRLSKAPHWQDAILWLMLKSPNRFQLRFLRVDIAQPLDQVYRAIVEVGPLLEELELEVKTSLEYTRMARESPPSDNPLRTCTALRRFTLRFIDTISLRSAVVLLENVPRAHLEHLGFGMIGRVHRSEGLCLPNFAELGEALRAHDLAGVRSFHFSYDGTDSQDEIWQCLKDFFPQTIMDKMTYTHVLKTL